MLKLFLVFFVLTLVVMFLMSWMGRDLGKTIKGGIVTFELAGSPARAWEMLSTWKDADAGLLGTARTQIRVDFLFIALYPVSIALACLLVRNRYGSWGELWLTLGGVLACAQLFAGLFDVCENLALLKVIRTFEGAASQADFVATVPPVPEWAALFATCKFGLVIAGVLYAVIGFAAIPRGVRVLLDAVGA